MYRQRDMVGGCKATVAAFEDGGRGHEPKDADGLGKARKGIVPQSSQKGKQPYVELLTSKTVR